jgi:hypothetical protein
MSGRPNRIGTQWTHRGLQELGRRQRCSREEGEATAGCHGGGGGPSRPPWTGGRSGQRSSRREREAPWELGRLRQGRCEELEGRGVCLGGCCGWCGSFQANRGPFYRPGGRGRGRPVGGRRRGAWRRASPMPCAAALGACWRGVVSATGYCG